MRHRSIIVGAVVSVLHYVEHWLELSAGFVHAQVSRSRHRGVVVSHNATENRRVFPHRPVLRLDRIASRVPAHRWPDMRSTALTAIATGFRARVVHVHFGYVVGDVTGVVQRKRLPLVLSLHGSDATELPRRQPGHYDGVRDLVDAVIVPSQFLAEHAAGLGFAAEQVHVIPSGVDPSFFTPTPVPANPVVTFVGRLVEKKGLDVLLAAWPLVVAAVPGARLDVVGAGPLATLLPRDDTSVRHLMPVPDRRAEQVRDSIRAARVVVSPSRTAADGDAESLLLVNLEAQASGRAVVTTAHGGIPEFVENQVSAILVDEGDAEQLAAALVAAVAEPGLAERLGNAGPAVAARYDVNGCVARVDALYDELVAQKRHAPRG